MRTYTSPRKARGAAAIEFSLVFIILFMLFYGIVGYFAPFLLAASYQQVAGEALREAITIRYQPSESGALQALQTQVRETIDRSMADQWLAANWPHTTCSDYVDGFLRMGDNHWQVCLRHDGPVSIVPVFELFGWQIPKLPDEIRGEASICLVDC